jgi:hypothetical protein
MLFSSRTDVRKCAINLTRKIKAEEKGNRVDIAHCMTEIVHNTRLVTHRRDKQRKRNRLRAG